jgi:proteasome lid subunit RPN8/RPN11
MLTIPMELVSRLHELAKRRLPNEMVCLLGAPEEDTDFLVVAVEVRNDAMEPTTHWVVRPYEQYEVEQQFAAQNRVLRAVAHSHPERDTSPSKTDTTFCPNGIAMLIVSVPDKEVAVFEHGEGQDWKIPVPGSTRAAA